MLVLTPDPDVQGPFPDTLSVSRAADTFLKYGEKLPPLTTYFKSPRVNANVAVLQLSNLKDEYGNALPHRLYSRDMDSVASQSTATESRIRQIFSNIGFSYETFMADQSNQWQNNFQNRGARESEDFSQFGAIKRTLPSLVTTDLGLELTLSQISENKNVYHYETFIGLSLSYEGPVPKTLTLFLMLPCLMLILNFFTFVRWYKLINRFKITADMDPEAPVNDMDSLSIMSFIGLELIMSMTERTIDLHRRAALFDDLYFVFIQRIAKVFTLAYIVLLVRLALCRVVACLRSSDGFLRRDDAVPMRSLFLLADTPTTVYSLGEKLKFFTHSLGEFVFSSRRFISKNKHVFWSRVVFDIVVWLFFKIKLDYDRLQTWSSYLPFLYFMPLVCRCIYYRLPPPQTGLQAGFEFCCIASYMYSMLLFESEVFDGVFLPKHWMHDHLDQAFFVYMTVAIVFLLEGLQYLNRQSQIVDGFNYYSLEELLKSVPSDCCICFEQIDPREHALQPSPTLDRLKKAVSRKSWYGSKILGHFYRWFQTLRSPQFNEYSFAVDPNINIQLGYDAASCWVAFTNSCCIRTPCSHLFHTTCLNGWIKNNLTCPLCREKLPIPRPFYMVKSMCTVDVKNLGNEVKVECAETPEAAST